jgi:hypothetical protein
MPRSSAEAQRLRRLYFFSGKPCRNGHVALSKVHHGCVICIGLSKARSEIRLHERIAERELNREGPVRRRKAISPDTAEGRVLIAIAERDGVFTQSELVDSTTRGMGKAIVSRAFGSLLRRKYLQTDAHVTHVTLAGWVEAKRLGASLVYRKSDWNEKPVKPAQNRDHSSPRFAKS